MIEYIGQLSELELSTLEQAAKAFSRIRTSEEVLQAACGKSQRLGDGEITMTGVLKFL